MTTFSSRRFPILFSKHRATTGLADTIGRLDVVALCREYDQLRKAAPSRAARNKAYFVGHDGCLRAKNPGNPLERHLAIALWRRCVLWPRADGGWMRLIDYEFPLRASMSDAKLGKVDLLGVTDRGRLTIVELKVRRKNGSRGDTPLRALMEGLRYTAVVHANRRAIAAEAWDRFAVSLSDEPPIIEILATEDWWLGWCDMGPSTRRAAGPWESKFLELSADLEARLGVVIECVSLQGIKLAAVTWDEHGRPRLGHTPPMRRICLDGVSASAPAIP